MMLSDPSKGCILKGETCIRHKPCPILQIFSLKVAKIPVDSGSVELYGYIAARDLVDPLLNYVVNISRDGPIIVKQGSFIEMTGPKRGIEMSCTILLEYDMRIKLGDQEKDDLQLIDGVSIIDELITWCKPVTQRIHGNYGAVDFAQMCLENAVEATVEVVISEVQSSFDLYLSCFTSGLHDEIRLFDGVIGEPRRLSRNVVAVVIGTCIDLKFKSGSGSNCCAEHCHSFKATNHGCATQQIKIQLASISVKVTWSTLNLGMMDLL
ncbi:hypothetical protein BS78_04G137000 [Paspalum vaginatum]|nr:hypothetical protein BS78_04G137000 [Paspalum vaginatum]